MVRMGNNGLNDVVVGEFRCARTFIIIEFEDERG